MSFYALILFGHSYLRWAIVICLLVLLFRCVTRTGKPWTQRDERLHVILVAFFDLQLLLGLALYFGLSPVTQQFLGNAAQGMKQPVLRFFGVEHVLLGLIALVVLHVGRVRSRRSPDARVRRRRVLVSLSIVLVLLLAALPWPGRPDHRPLLRGLSTES
ncbi:MAG: hypothetical protein ABW321_27080 [Polyangiales bacterium]